jgi:biopolymer transport protein ExbD
MSSGPQDTQDESLSEVNVIPLADLSLVLLIILMVLSPMIMQSMIKVQSSRASAIHKATKKPEPPLILNIINATDVELNSVKISNDLDLASRLAAQLGDRDDKTVMLTVRSAVPHGRFVTVLDIVKQQGADKIALLRGKDSGQAVAIAAPAKKP